MTRRKLVVGNWKMHGTLAASRVLAAGLRPSAAVDVAVAPPFTAVNAVAAVLVGKSIRVAAQNCHWESSGAYTGEVSPEMVVEAGGAWVILGHSERRQLFGETDATVQKKLAAAQAAGLAAIVCVGETLEEREAGSTIEVVTRQLTVSLGRPKTSPELAVAYEPVWAIGTGKTATPAQAQEVHAAIRRHVASTLGPEVAKGLRILYGGSVKPENARELLTLPDVDGALVGGASLKADSFNAIVAAGE